MLVFKKSDIFLKIYLILKYQEYFFFVYLSIRMLKVKKIHRIIFLFILIFLLGIYFFMLYIGNTIDQKNKINEQSEINSPVHSDREATQIN